MESVSSGPVRPSPSAEARVAAAASSNSGAKKAAKTRKSRPGRQEESGVNLADLKKITEGIVSDLCDSDLEVTVMRGN